MRHYYHAATGAISALPAQTLHDAVNLPDGSVFCSVDWQYAANDQELWESRPDVQVWGTLLEASIPPQSAGKLAVHGVAASDGCHDAVKKMVKKFGGMRVAL